jgi:hypothetical protein
MSFEYGSKGLAVRNPFRLEGLFYILRGIVMALLGALLIFSLRGGLTSEALAAPELRQALIVVKLLGGAFLLAMGLGAFGIGLFKCLRFYVGRGSPADLKSRVLGDADLAGMLKKRINPMFVEPRGIFTRAVHGLFPRLLVMPWPVRIATTRLSVALYDTVLILLLLGLAVFSGSIGLTPIHGDVLVGWLTLIAAAAILVVWLRACPSRTGWLNAANMPKIGIKRTVILVIGAIVLPAIFVNLPADIRIPPSPLPAGAWLFWLTLGGIVVTVAGVALAVLRMQAARAVTEVSEFRQHWSESMHPADIFRAFDMVMADHRYLEIPNREYREADAQLELEGSANKGGFKGESLVEIQPQPAKLALPSVFTPVRSAVLIAAHLVMLAGAIWLYLGLSGLADVTVAIVSGSIVAPLVLWLFGTIGGRVANLYIAEVPFLSHLIHFFAEGTYTESKISTGMAITDSTRSENVLVRSSLTPWIFLSRIESSTFAVSGAHNLEQLRYVLEIEKDNGFLNRIVEDLRRFIDSRQMIADVRSESDLQSTVGIHNLNASTRANSNQSIAFRPEDRDGQKSIGVDLDDSDGDLDNPPTV